ncbi:SDR family oxidoreductase [Celerinatantimonas yamalensis]|uniref:SDR family oxidoreductase n=1 Tax=Celerinatantimonas yamalensis TaxID=559956 RepID=A0ABW9G449_9GAMM
MNLTGNTILVTGGSSGIGKALAESLHKLGNQVIITGRNVPALSLVTSANPGMRSEELDISNPLAIQAFGRKIVAEFPDLNVLINNAGIQFRENLKNQEGHVEAMEALITTNLLGPLRLTAALLPHLLTRDSSTVINVTSGLGFVPGTWVPTYSATKAAHHSYTVSLRRQMRDTSVEVLELIPPYVQTNLGPGHGSDPAAMPLAEFIDEVIAILRSGPEEGEIVVDRCLHLRRAVENGNFEEIFHRLNG